MVLKRLSDTVPVVTSKVFARKYIALGRIVTQWQDIVGSDIAAKAQPVKIHYRKGCKDKKRKSEATLDVAVTSADSTFMHYQKGVILEKINRIFGDNWITDIKFKHVPVEAKKERPRKMKKPLLPTEKKNLSGMLENIDDPDIKSALERFGTSFLQDRQ